MLSITKFNKRPAKRYYIETNLSSTHYKSNFDYLSLDSDKLDLLLFLFNPNGDSIFRGNE